MQLRPKIFLISTAMTLCAFLYACNLDNFPTDSSQKQLKTEKKWLCDNITAEKVRVLSLKEYNKDGDLTKWSEFYDNGGLSSEAVYTYDGYITSINKTYYNTSGAADSLRISSIEKDFNGNVTKKTVFDDQGLPISVATYSYDNSGNLVNKKVTNGSGEIQSEVNYTYCFNKNGNVISRLHNPAPDGSFQSKDSLIYNSGDKQSVDRLSFDSSGSLELKYTYIYNNYGQIVEEIVTDKDGTIKHRYQYDYTYYF